MIMKIKLQGIGIIKDSEIELNGLTVITGDNNSGKTTVGKVVYSLFDAVSNIQEKAENDRNTYAMRTLQFIARDLNFLSVCFREDSYEHSELFTLFNRRPIRQSRAISLAKSLYDWLRDFRETGFDLLDDETRDYIIGRVSGKFRNNDNTDFTAVECMNFLIDMAFESLDKLFKNLDTDPDLIDYARENISQTLKVEFSGQIQPVKLDLEKSTIIIKESGKNCFCIDITNNNIFSEDNLLLLGSSIKSALFVDNPFVLDSTDFIQIRDYDHENDDNFLNKNRIRHHDVRLRQILKTKTNNIFETNILEKQFKEINAKINEVIEGDFEFTIDGDYYIDKGRKLRFSNLATGSKLFSILKLLINRGALTESTVLVLDEPEAHLHPAWQNKFAEIIVMLVKELNVKVLLTSHSPNFVLAIDAFMRKYEINDKTNFYQTRLMEDGLAEYVNVNNDIGRIYSDFVQYLTEVKILRNRYMYGLGDNDD